MEYNTLGAVDLGSNSFHLAIGRVVDDQIYPLDSLKETVRLANGLGPDKQLDAAAQERALATLKRFAERLAGMRQQLSGSTSQDAVHEYTIEGLISRFGEDAPDGVRIVVASRVDMPDHGCLCCGVSADRRTTGWWWTSAGAPPSSSSATGCARRRWKASTWAA